MYVVVFVVFHSTPSYYFYSRDLRIYGASASRSDLEPQLVWATPGQRGFPKGQPINESSHRAVIRSRTTTQHNPGPSGQRAGAPARTAAQQQAMKNQQEALQKAAELKQMLNTLEKVDDESRRSSLLDTLCSKDDILNLPLHPNPPSIRNGNLKVDLLKHQVSFFCFSEGQLCLTNDILRIKHCNGVLNANTLFFRKRSWTNQFNSGNIGKPELKFVGLSAVYTATKSIFQSYAAELFEAPPKTCVQHV